MTKTIRSIFIASVFLLAATLVQAQVGIGTNSPHSSAKFEVRSNNKGVLLPSISLTGTNDVSTISSPATGLLIYNSNTVSGLNAVTPGFYYFNGTAWVRLIVPTDNAANVTGTIAVANGGTGATTALAARANLGLDNVNNTSDANKPVSTATQAALDTKASINNPTFTGTVGGITKAMVGLGNVDNTSDADKPVSAATQTALNTKASINSPTFTGTVAGITKTMVGLGNVDNTSDADKPISTATQAALDAKAPINNPTFTGAVGGITKIMVGLGNVDNTSDADKPVSTATQAALNAKAPINNPTFTGTVGGITKAMVGLGNVDNTSDADKPVSAATQTALNTKAPINSPTFTGTVVGITKAMVGLGNVDNTSDAGKPVSTATQAALDLKENASNKSNSTSLGTSDILYPTQNAVKTYVDAQTTPDASSAVKGKIQLAGDLTGTAATPTIAAAAISSTKLADDAVTTTKIANAAVTDAKIATVSASKVTGNISGNASNVTGIVAVVNGGTGADDAASARTNLGATTIGGNFFTLANPSAISFPRLNADNTISTLSASDFRAAIGAGTSSTSGTVTSVGLSLPSILSVSGSPVTSSGILSASLANQNTNLVFAGPGSGSAAAPTFRALVAADIPTLNQNTTGTASNVTGTVAVANGGTGTTTGSITGTGALTFTAGGTNQDITLAPSGTGNIILNNNVGIGTTSPTSRLNLVGGGIKIHSGFANNTARPSLTASTIGNYEIRGVGSITGTTQIDEGNDGFLRLSAGGGTHTSTQSSIDLSGFSLNGDMDRNIVMRTAGTERLRIDNSGNVNVTGRLNVTDPSSNVVTKASGIVNAGTFVQLDNLKVTCTASGNRGLSIGAVSTTFTASIGGTFGGVGGSGGTSAYNVTYTTAASSSTFNWHFGGAGDISTYIITDTTNNRAYRVTLQIGFGYNNNLISIERLH